MSDIKVGRKVEILSVETFNDNIVEVGCIAEIVAVNDKYIAIDRHDWEFSQVSSLSQEGEAWKLVPPTVEAPTINSEPFITIKGVEVGSSLERALNLVVAVYNGDSVMGFDGNCYIDDASRSITSAANCIDNLGMSLYELKSEEEALKAKNIKEALDKEIKELEDKLQELKTKRGD